MATILWRKIILTKIIKYSFLFFVLFSSIEVLGQNYTIQLAPGEALFQALNDKCKANILVNGKHFENIYVNDLGHPYFVQDEFKKGWTVLHGVKFEDISLKYNIWDQTLLIQQNKNVSNTASFIPPFDFISEFNIDGRYFKKEVLGDSEERFYEVIYQGEITCLCSWDKLRSESDHKVSFVAYKFSEQKAKFYLVTGDDYQIIKGKKTLIKKYPEYKKQISQYIDEQGIKFYKLNGLELKKLLTFCEQLKGEK